MITPPSSTLLWMLIGLILSLVVGSVARFHYSFMGGSRPEDMEPYVPEVANLLRCDEVDTVLLSPV